MEEIEFSRWLFEGRLRQVKNVLPEYLSFDHFLAFLRSTELKSLIFESKLHVFDIETISTKMANSISVRKGHR